MKQVALIACCKTKLDTAVPVAAEKLYLGQLFKAQLAYARKVLQLPDDRIFVLSAKYTLVGLQEEILPYEATLAERGVKQRIAWGQCVMGMLREQGHYPYDKHFVVMAGRLYQEGLVLHLKHREYEWSVPHPSSLGYGEQVSWYQNEALKKTKCTNI
jgi:hypothetical protein